MRLRLNKVMERIILKSMRRDDHYECLITATKL
jgi:hypothetical protein